MWFALPRRHFRCDSSLHWHWYFDDRSIGGIRCAPLNHKRTNDAHNIVCGHAYPFLPLSRSLSGFHSRTSAACKGDYDKYCKGAVPGGGRVLACLNRQYAQLTEACKKVVDLQKK
jgi:hypothetical protein